LRYWSLFSWRGQKHALNGLFLQTLAGATQEVFGRLKAAKAGVAPAHSGVLPAPKIECRVMRILTVPQTLPFTAEVNGTPVE